MDFRTALVRALFIIVISPLGTSQDVPDGVVYTELMKTLVSGSKGVLTCRFKGTPNAVYWRKGSNPDTAPFVMSWGYGTKYGPRYEDGSCDINTNYSLVIKTVRDTDAGRYICRVSNYKGVLKHNYTDVTVSNIAVKTEPNVAVQMGKVGVLPCKILIRPGKVSWVKGVNTTLVTLNPSDGVIDISGPEHEGIFNMTKDYSLVINDVTLQHEDNYFCEVIAFDTDRIYRDLTALTVYAQPREPFPIIEGCPIEDHTNCIITTGSSITLTCHVNEYYPDINLFFMHGSKRVESIDTKTWNNTDGTKNKSTTISADQSKDAYKCIASGIPGRGNVSTSVRLIQEQRNSLILTAVFVPIVICLTGILFTWMKLRKRGKRLSNEEECVEDHRPISFAELWQLAEFITDLERNKLVNLIKSLNGNEELPTNFNRDICYQELCKWKNANTQSTNQRKALYKKLHVGMDKAFKQLEGVWKDTSAEVSKYDFEHILWQIDERQKIAHFFEILGVNIPTEKIPMERKLTEMKLTERKIFIQEAVDQLASWAKGDLTFNPVFALSLALEQMGMCTRDNHFFQLPAEEKEGSLKKDFERHMRNLTKNHCEKLKKILKATGSRAEIWSTKIASENNKVLFDTEKMLRDWWEDVACSNYDKWRKLEEVCQHGQEGSTDIKSTANGAWISDEELKIISRYLDQASMESLCEKLCNATLEEDTNEKGRYETLCVWRESVTESEWVSMYGHLRNALGEVGILGLLAPLKDKPISKAEYVDIAFTLLMSDVIPAARALGINDNKLPAYRRIFDPAHLKEGTIGLVAQFVELTNIENARLELCSRLREAGLPLAIARKILVRRMACGEFYAISEEMKKCPYEQMKDDDNHDEEKPPGEGDSLLRRDNTSTERETPVKKVQEEETMVKRHLTEIKKMLKLSEMTDEDLAECPILKECQDEFALYKIWKERPHLAVFNERAAIIQGLFDMQRDDIARFVAEGNYYNTEISLPFVQSIVKKMNKQEILRLAEVFDIKKEVEGAKKSDDFANFVSRIIHGSIRKDKPKRMKFRKAKEDMDLIDKLVENSFLYIAQELIISRT